MSLFCGKRELREDFTFLGESVYFDSACQSMRPQAVIDAVNQYYREYNSCGERVKYDWGKKIDSVVESARATTLKYLKLSPKDYFVSFTLNTTYGLNLVLNQLKRGVVEKVITSDSEHNSPFLATLAFAKKQGIEREVISWHDSGELAIEPERLKNALVVLGVVNNFDATKLKNLQEVVEAVHKAGGLVVLDAAQSMTFGRELLAGVPADAICFSSHKMYGPSLGVIVARRDLLTKLEEDFIGGGMVDDVVSTDSYVLSAGNSDHAHTRFEPGLQAWAEIIGYKASLDWLMKNEKYSEIAELSSQVFDFLKESPKVEVINQQVSPIISFYHKEIDAHLLAEALSTEGIMARSGYFCCHYYLDKVKKYPPLLRLSFGLHNNQADVDRLLAALEKVVR